MSGGRGLVISGGVGLPNRIDELVEVYGSLRTMGKALTIDAGYLARLRAGKKAAPSETVLAKLGLRKVTLYERR